MILGRGFVAHKLWSLRQNQNLLNPQNLHTTNRVRETSTEESIYGLETDPVDSKLDLARAYLDMGDEKGARLVLTEVIREGNLTQQAEARELLLRLEVS